MSEKKFYWLKLKDDFFSSKEIKKLRRVAGGDTHVIIYLKLQLLSIRNEGVIHFDATEETIAEQLHYQIDEDEENINLTLNFLTTHNLIEIDTKDEIFVKSVLPLIGSEGGTAQRVRLYREKQKVLQCNTDVTPCNKSVTQREERREKRKETRDKRKELDIEKEKKEKILKKKFSEFDNVLLSDDEFSKLESKFGKDDLKDKIEKLSLYLESTGKNYKSHYATILSWAKNEKPKTVGENGKPLTERQIREQGQYTTKYNIDDLILDI